MEDLKINSPSIALGKKHKTNFKDSESDHVFKNVWEKYFIPAERIIVGQFNQIQFSFVENVKAYLKSQIISAKKAIKNIFKKAERKIQSVSVSNQLSIEF